MGRHSLTNRATFGGFMTVTGLILAFSGGFFKIIGILMLLGGLVSLFFTFYRPR